jgi:TP901 family phage tail tape measure protein
MTDIATLGLKVDSTGVTRATDQLGKFGKEGKKAEGVAGKLGKTGKAAFGAMAVAAAGAVAAIASIGSAISVIRQFETSMSQVAAVTGATRGEMEALRDVAKELGSTTEFSAAQAADGLKFLGMAGFDASESIAAIPAVLDLATASSMGLAQAADIASNVLSGFGLEAGQAGQVADVLAAASSRANTDVSQLGRAMSTVAPISAALGIDLADTAAAIGVMSDAGIQGERAGTALRAVFASLAGPTSQAQEALAKYGLTAAQVNPETHSLTEIFGVLQERGLSTADAMAIFGREAASGALVLAEASGRVGEFGDELREAEGAASDMAGVMRDNLGGSANEALSALQGLAIAIGEAGLTAVLRAGLTAVTALARGLTDITTSVTSFFAAFQGKDQMQAAFESATDNVTIALGDQIRQLGRLQQAMTENGAVSISVAKIRLAEAEAIREVIAAEKAQLVQKTLLNAGYGDLLGRIEATRAAMRGINAGLSEGDGAAAMQVESYRQLEKTMVALLEDQQAMLASARENVSLSAEQEQALVDAEAAAATLRTQIENMGDGLVLVNGQWVEVASLSDRTSASVSGINFSTAIAGAEGLADRLGVSLGLARAIAVTVGSSQTPDEVFDPRSSRFNPELQKAANREAELARLREMFEAENAAAAKAAASVGKFSSAAGGAAKAAGGAAKEVEDFADEIQRLEFDADPLKKYNAGIADLDKLLENGLSDGAYQKAVAELNEEFVRTSPILSDVNDAFGQMVDYAFGGFKDGMKGIWNIFVDTLRQMVATAAKTQITFGLGMSGGGIGQALGGGGGIFGKVLGSFGNPGGGGVLGGLGGLWQGISGGFSSGGIGGAISGGFGAISKAIGGIGSGLGGVTAALGAVAPIALGAFALSSAFKRKLKGSGIQGTFSGADGFTGETFKRYGGNLFSGAKTKTGSLDDDLAAELQRTYARLVSDTQDFATIFGQSATDFSAFSTDFKINLKGLSEQEAADKIAANFGKIEDALLGFAFGEATVAALGGIEGFKEATSFYYENFFTEQERQQREVAKATAVLNDEFAILGLAIPRTTSEFRKLVEAQDLATAAGQQNFAALMGVADEFITARAVGAAGGTAQSFGQQSSDSFQNVWGMTRSDFHKSGMTWDELIAQKNAPPPPKESTERGPDVQQRGKMIDLLGGVETQIIQLRVGMAQLVKINRDWDISGTPGTRT